MSVEDAIKKWAIRQDKKEGRNTKKRTNKKPEKDVEKQVLQWAKGFGMQLHVVEAKAGFSQKSGGYYMSHVKAGFLDLVGNYKHLACFVELKAMGKRSTLRYNQRQFIITKIEQGAFACVTDCVEHFKNIFTSWLSTKDADTRKQILLDDLPKERQQKDDGGLFDD